MQESVLRSLKTLGPEQIFTTIGATIGSALQIEDIRLLFYFENRSHLFATCSTSDSAQ